MRVDDSRLQGIPRYKTNNCKSLSLARCEFKRLAEDPLGQADMLVARISVARVRPRKYLVTRLTIAKVYP